MASWLHVDIAAFKAHVAALLDQYPEMTEDEELRADMIEGETDLHRLVDRILRIALDAKTMAEAVKARKQEIEARQKRYERKEEGAKKLLRDVLLAADLSKVTLPDATVSITKPRTKVVVTSVDDLPQGYYQIERKPKTADIKATLEAGETIPGAQLELGEEGLMVRTR